MANQLHLVVIILLGSTAEGKCPFPGTPRHGRLVHYTDNFPDESYVRYECDEPYRLFGEGTRHCDNGTWTNEIPECLREVAFRKITSISVPENTSDDAFPSVDNDPSTCVYSAVQKPEQMWFIDLVEETRVKFVEVMFADRFRRITIDVRVGNQNPKLGHLANRLCFRTAFEPFRGDFHSFKCFKTSTPGRYVSIIGEMAKDRINICEARVYASSHHGTELAPSEACPRGYPDSSKEVYKNKCLEFIRHKLMTLDEARSTCAKHNATLVTHVTDNFQQFIQSKLNAVYATDMNFYAGYMVSFWLGANRDKETGTWSWLDGSRVAPEYTPKNNHGDCMYAKNDEWNSTDCGSKHGVICQYDALTCGRVAIPEGAIKNVREDIDYLRRGSSFKHRCEGNSYPSIDSVHCNIDGSLSNFSDPLCLPRNCPTKIENGTLEFQPDTNIAVVSCFDGMEPVNSEHILCVNGAWSEEPRCKRIIYSSFMDELRGMFKKHLCFANLSFGAILTLLAVVGLVMIIVSTTLITCVWCLWHLDFPVKVNVGNRSFVVPMQDLPVSATLNISELAKSSTVKHYADLRI